MRLLGTRLARVLLIALAVAPSAARAQAPGDVQPAGIRRPFRGLFGVPAAPGSSQALDVTASAYGAYDDDVFAASQGGGALSSDVRQSGYYGGFESGLNYVRNGRRVAFGADAGLGVTAYANEPLFVVYRTGVNLSAPLARNTSLSLAESFVYAPEYRLGLFISPTQGDFTDPFSTVSPDHGLFRERSYRTSTNVGVTQTLRDRSSISAFYSLSTANYESDELNYWNQGGGVRYQRQLTRRAGLHLGYNYGTSQYRNMPTYNRGGIHNLDVGVDYGRALSVSRRTQFSFTTGSAVFYGNQGITNGPDNQVNFALLGSATLSHEMGRTWTTSVAYQRSVSFQEGFLVPFLSQSVSGNVQGLLSRLLQFSASTYYTRGVVGAGTTNEFDSAGANAGLQYALTRHLAAYVNYVYYQYSFPPGVAIDPRFPQRLARNGVRVGLQTSIPVIRAK
jgi:opacity protein-like surface antigen